MPVNPEKKRAAARLVAQKVLLQARASARPAATATTPSSPSRDASPGRLLRGPATTGTGSGQAPIRIRGSVGRGGKNQPEDVEAVQARLGYLGYECAADLDSLVPVIERYQSQVVRLDPPDGRVDVGGRTLASLVAGRKSALVAPPARARSTPYPAKSAVPPAVPGGPSTSPEKGDLPDLVKAANNPAVDAAAAKLAALQHTYKSAKRFRGADHTAHGEMSGHDRDELIEEIGRLRKMVADLTQSGLPVEQTKDLQAAFYRAIDLVSPYYYQHNNVMLEYSTERGAKHEVFNTCNITSLAMCLQALGLTASNYDHPELLPPIIEYFKSDIGKALEVTSSDLTGYRLPDVLGMAAVAENLTVRDKPGHDHLESAASAAMEWVPNIIHMKILASRFGVPGQTGSYHHDTLAAYGKDHWQDASKRSDQRREGGTVDDQGLSTEDIEHQLPLKKFTEDVLAVIRPALDAGKQVVAGQYNHFVRIESVDDTGVVKDDPGNWLRSDDQLTWEEARALGLFENYLILG